MSNLSQQKRDRMLAFLEQLKTVHSEDDSILTALNEIESELNAKKYGLVWEEHEEAVDIRMQTHIPVFTEDTEKEITADDSGAYNFLIEGDNLHSLYLLEKTHKGKIDVIYIDPPYNTGNKDFKYDDTFVDKTDLFAHSKWISFMAERLRIAKELLSEKGCIFISIDDNEQSALKMLCDEIFGVDNFLIQMPRVTKKSGKSTDIFAKNHDYLLVYSKTENYSLTPFEHNDSGFKNKDEYFEERGFYKLNQTLDYDSLQYSQSLDYPLEIDGITYYAGTSYEKYLQRQAGEHKRADWAWRWSLKKFQFGYENGFIVVKKGKNGTRIYTKTYQNATISENNGEYYIKYIKRTTPVSSLSLSENEYSNDNATKVLTSIFSSKKFDYSKPVSLIKFICKLVANKNALILDFFAGSGTTAQAVLELNQQDDGHRKFILCTNNENNICTDVTYPRIQTVITGKRQDGSQYSDGIPANLKYYHTDFVTKDEEYLSEELLKHIAEMIQLEHGVKLDGKQYIMLLTDEEADDLAEKWADYPEIKAIYISSSVLLTTAQERLFKDTEIHIIPDYYFNFELKELYRIW